MIAQLATVKNRLAIPEADIQHDALLTSFIEAAGAIFDRECHRTFARTVDAVCEFPADATEICVPCYPIETVSLFELKHTELEGWLVQSPPEYLVRAGCVVSLALPLGSSRSQARVTYTGGYVMPGTVPAAGQSVLPADLAHAAVEQVAAWFLHRDKIGLVRNWPGGGVYQQFVALPLLPIVSAVLARHERWMM